MNAIEVSAAIPQQQIEVSQPPQMQVGVNIPQIVLWSINEHDKHSERIGVSHPTLFDVSPIPTPSQ